MAADEGAERDEHSSPPLSVRRPWLVPAAVAMAGIVAVVVMAGVFVRQTLVDFEENRLRCRVTAQGLAIRELDPAFAGDLDVGDTYPSDSGCLPGDDQLG